VALLEKSKSRSTLNMVSELSGKMWGMRELLSRAAREFHGARGEDRRVPTVSIVGEIYVRLDPFANDHLVERLEERGLRVRMAPFVEWLEYSNLTSERRLIDGTATSLDDPMTTGITGLVQRVTARLLYEICRREMGWGARTKVEDVLVSGERYVSPALTGEAVLTVGGPVHEFEEGEIDAVVVVGPHECMPCKISEAQFGKVGEHIGLPSLTVYIGGDGVDVEAIDRFAFDLHERMRAAQNDASTKRNSLVMEFDSTRESYDSERLSVGE
jgi:predicted nucleotide-binding protein (sugar kinase/HSP70/actin superfamily)